MNQQKTGEFLKHLRKEQGLTQEQLAEAFYVSSRTVSRWETGSNMPDLEILIELADFYHVDIREIIDGERKSENMDNETKDTLKKSGGICRGREEKNKEQAEHHCVIFHHCDALRFLTVPSGEQRTSRGHCAGERLLGDSLDCGRD